jgi:hypothetical protein
MRALGENQVVKVANLLLEGLGENSYLASSVYAAFLAFLGFFLPH